jgi:tubulin alpha
VNDCASVHYTLRKEVIDLRLERIRRLTDDCAGMQDFMIFYGFSVDTAARFRWFLLERLVIDSGKKGKLDFKIYSARQCRLHSSGCSTVPSRRPGG